MKAGPEGREVPPRSEVVVHWSLPGCWRDDAGCWRYWILACTGEYARGPGDARDYQTCQRLSRVNCPGCRAAGGLA